MYGVGGERRLTEFVLNDLPGYEGSKPVRVGNAASEQFQLDVYGEVAAVMFIGAERLGRIDRRLWPRWRAIIEHVETIWRRPDDGIWEARGPQRHYTYSKVMAWVVFDRGVRLAERFELDAPLDRWKQVRDEIHAEVCERGYDAERRTFTQYYGSKELDASVLNIPLVGFLREPMTASPGRSTQSPANSAATGSCRATRPPTPMTGCRETRDSSWPARSGSSTRSRATGASSRRVRCSSGSWRSATTLDCSPRSTTSPESASSATSRKRSATSR
jgi:hypothetical protein